MKKLIIFLIAGVLFANMKLINQKIVKDSIIITFKVDPKTFNALNEEKNTLQNNTKKTACSKKSVKQLLTKYNLIYKYQSNKKIITIEVKKGSCQ